MPRQSLFRQEALEAHAAHAMGSIRIAQPVGHAIAAAVSVLLIVLIGLFAFFGTYTRRATVPGLLEPVAGTLRLTAPASGRVGASRIVEGARVAAGDVLFVLSGERLSATGATHATIGAQMVARRLALERDLELSKERDASRARSTRERLAAIDVESERLARETAIHAEREAIAAKVVERFDALARTGFISPMQAQARLDESLVLAAQRESYRRLAANLARERAGLLSQLDESRLQGEAERAQVARNAAALAQEASENDARETAVVVAPYDAIVTGIVARDGQFVGTGALLATLIPAASPLQAQLLIPTRQAGFIERGQRVRLRYAAYPFQKFGFGEGVVDVVERSPYAPQELTLLPTATTSPAADLVYRAVVRLDAQAIRAYGVEHALKPGMVLEADVMQDTRRLYEWGLEPVYAVVGR